jgi:hypothetical protein
MKCIITIMNFRHLLTYDVNTLYKFVVDIEKLSRVPMIVVLHLMICVVFNIPRLSDKGY